MTEINKLLYRSRIYMVLLTLNNVVMRLFENQNLNRISIVHSERITPFHGDVVPLNDLKIYVLQYDNRKGEAQLKKN